MIVKLIHLQSSPILEISSQHNRSTLLIPESLVENSGIYTVKAENPAGSVTSTATLTVEKPLEEEDFTPPVVAKPLSSNLTVMDGEEVKLSCQVMIEISSVAQRLSNYLLASIFFSRFKEHRCPELNGSTTENQSVNIKESLCHFLQRVKWPYTSLKFFPKMLGSTSAWLSILLGKLLLLAA